MFEKLKKEFLGAVNAGNYQEAKAILVKLSPYLSTATEEALVAALDDEIQKQEILLNEAPIVDSQARSIGDSTTAEEKAADDDKGDLTDVDWGGIASGTFGGIAAIINAANGTTPDNITNVNNEVKEEEKATPIGWYIGGGLGVLALIFVLFMLMNKKPK